MRRAVVLSAIVLAGCGAQRATIFPTPHSPNCALYASPTGASGNPGTSASPKDLASMVGALTAGHTGCLLAGTYGATPDSTGATANTGTYWHFTNSGSSAGQITVTAAPNDASVPTVLGWFREDGSYVTWSHVNIDGSNTYDDSCAQQTANSFSSQSATVPSDCDQTGGGYACPNATATNYRYRSQDVDLNGTGDVLDHDSIYQSYANIRRNLVGIGFQATTSNVTIRYSLLHDAGGCGSQHDHLLYVHTTTGGAQVYDNWFYNGHGGQSLTLYPSSAGTHLFGNVSDSSDFGFAIGGSGSTNNAFDHNLATNLGTLTYDTNTTTPGAALSCSSAGTGNTVDTMDYFNDPGNMGSCGVATPTNTASVDPQYVNAASHDYTVQSSSLSSWGMPTLSQMGPSGR